MKPNKNHNKHTNSQLIVIAAYYTVIFYNRDNCDSLKLIMHII